MYFDMRNRFSGWHTGVTRFETDIRSGDCSYSFGGPGIAMEALAKRTGGGEIYQ